MVLAQGNTGVIKYEVRSTKYEVLKFAATELRGWSERTQSEKRHEAYIHATVGWMPLQCAEHP